MHALYTVEADLYDVAFSWDTSGDIEWFLGRLGGDCAPVLEPACGSGRFLVGFGERGIEAVGIDSSRPMVRLAEQRLRSANLPGAAPPCPSLVVCGESFPEERGAALARLYQSYELRFSGLDHWDLVLDPQVRTAVAKWLGITAV
jgi:SAM-dependent methyltransferase